MKKMAKESANEELAAKLIGAMNLFQGLSDTLDSEISQIRKASGGVFDSRLNKGIKTALASINRRIDEAGKDAKININEVLAAIQKNEHQ